MDKNLPLLVQGARPCDTQAHFRDQAVLEDDLPLALTRNGAGQIQSRGTLVTDVRQETTDDN
jgi:hypothetical protein